MEEKTKLIFKIKTKEKLKDECTTMEEYRKASSLFSAFQSFLGTYVVSRYKFNPLTWRNHSGFDIRDGYYLPTDLIEECHALNEYPELILKVYND